MYKLYNRATFISKVNNKQYNTYLNIKLIFTAFPVPKLNCIYISFDININTP